MQIYSQQPGNQNLSYETELENFEIQLVESNLNHPWGITFIDENNLLVTERNGDLILLQSRDENWERIDRKILTGLPTIFRSGQGGLLDLAYNKQITGNWIYIYYSIATSGGQSLEIARFSLDLNSNSNRINNFQILYRAIPTISSRIHFGSRFAFDPEGFIYISLGERGNMDQAQDGTSSWGSILRLELDGTIPSDNPFVNSPSILNEIFSLGHRNPQGMYFDEINDQLWAHEHGPKGGDELNLIMPGVNYGWPIITYGINYNGQPIGIGTERAGLEQPIHYWDPSIAPSGMVIPQNSNFDHWNGDILIGALKFKQIIRLRYENSQIIEEEILLSNALGRIRTIIQGPDGNLWIINDEDNGQLFRIIHNP